MALPALVHKKNRTEAVWEERRSEGRKERRKEGMAGDAAISTKLTIHSFECHFTPPPPPLGNKKAANEREIEREREREREGPSALSSLDLENRQSEGAASAHLQPQPTPAPLFANARAIKRGAPTIRAERESRKTENSAEPTQIRRNNRPFDSNLAKIKENG